jgi:hypothetical protein
MREHLKFGTAGSCVAFDKSTSTVYITGGRNSTK